MKKSVFIMTLSVFSSLFLYAQENRSSHPQPDSLIKIIPIYNGRHTAYLYTIGGKVQAPEDIKLRLSNYPPSAAEYTKYRNNLTGAYLSFGGFVLSSIGAVIEYATNNKHVGETTGIVNGEPGFIYQQHNLGAAYILTGLATGCLVTSIVTLVNAHKHSKQALALYNRQFE
jgi:hypothetical protein